MTATMAVGAYSRYNRTFRLIGNTLKAGVSGRNGELLMCGIAGAINLTGRFSPGVIRGLIWANRERGTDSLGLFDTSGRIIKAAGDPSDIMAFDGFRDWIDNSARHAWGIGIHTRYATQGSVSDGNAHPFKYGRIVGSHNGMVHAPRKYIVDSEYLFDIIRKKGYKGLENCQGYWGLSWYDKKSEEFYLTMHAGSLAYAVNDGVCYYSSDKDHLSCFCSDVQEFSEGQVICFKADGSVLDSDQHQIDGLTVKSDYWEGYGCRGSYSGYPKTGKRSGYSGSATSTNKTVVRTYDDSTTLTPSDTDYTVGDDEENFREDWSEYLHAMSDEEFSSWEQRGYDG